MASCGTSYVVRNTYRTEPSVLDRDDIGDPALRVAAVAIVVLAPEDRFAGFDDTEMVAGRLSLL